MLLRLAKAKKRSEAQYASLIPACIACGSACADDFLCAYIAIRGGAVGGADAAVLAYSEAFSGALLADGGVLAIYRATASKAGVGCIILVH